VLKEVVQVAAPSLKLAGFWPVQVSVVGLLGRELSINVTVPVPGLGLTVAVNVTDAPVATGLPFALEVTDVTVLVVVAGLSVRVIAGLEPFPILTTSAVPSAAVIQYRYQVPFASVELIPPNTEVNVELP
jgi:hypothetical protein